MILFIFDRACADVTIIHDDGTFDSSPDLPPAQDDEDYNEVDTDRIESRSGGSYVGHVVALTLAGLLLPLILLAIILYFYFARETVRKVVKKHAGFWKRCAFAGDSSKSGGDGESDKNGNLTASVEAPKAPPRRNRQNSSSVSPSPQVEASPTIPV